MNVLLKKFFLNISSGVIGGCIVYLASRDFKISEIDIFVFVVLIIVLLSSFFIIKEQENENA